MTIYDYIAENNRRTIFLILSFLFLIATLAFLSVWLAAALVYDPEIHTGVGALAASMAWTYVPLALTGAAVWLFISYLSGDGIMMASAGAQEITRKDNPEIYSLVENTARMAGLPVPRVFIIEDSSANAFATGRSPEHASIALTTGIIKILDRSELEGVIAHEMAHIGNRDIRLMLLIVTGIGILTLTGQILLRVAFYSRGGGKNGNGRALFGLLGLLFLIYGFLIAPLIQYALSRSREYQADATGALLTRNPLALASALDKINKDSRVESLDKVPLMSAMCIEDATADKNQKGSGCLAMLLGLSATHPPVEERIKRLQAM